MFLPIAAFYFKTFGSPVIFEKLSYWWNEEKEYKSYEQKGPKCYFLNTFGSF